MKTTNINPLARPCENVDFVYRNPRPVLAIEHAGGRSLGNCYSATCYEVTSLRPLSMKDFNGLFDIGLLGCGQEFSVRQVVGDRHEGVPATLDWRSMKDVKPSGTDNVPCQMVDRVTGKVVPGEAINPYSGQPYAPNEQHYYIYTCETRCDSSG